VPAPRPHLARGPRRRCEGVGSDDVEQVWLDDSYHVATLDNDAEDIAARTAAFVARVTA
jgi:carboxylesterase